MADDLLVGIGVDVAAFRRDRATILSEAQGLQRDIVGALQGTQILPDLGTQARQLGADVVAGLKASIEGESGQLQAALTGALIPRSLATDVAGLRNTVRSGITGISKDFSAEGADSAAAFLASLDRGLAGAGAVFSGFSRQVTTALTGTTGILGDLTPQAEAAGRQLIGGLTASVQRDSGALRSAVSAAIVPTGLGTAFTPLLNAAGDASGTVVRLLGAAGKDGSRALTSGLGEGLASANTAITRFAVTASTTLERADLLAGLASQGTRGGALLVSGITRAITAGSGEIQRAVVASLVPTSLPTELRALTAAVATETARLVPVLTNTGTEAGRGLTTALTASLTAGTSTAITAFSRGASTAIAGTNLLGNLTPIGERAGAELSAGVQVALAREAGALRTSITAAIIPQSLTGEIGRLESTVTAGLARFPGAFAEIGSASGSALVGGLTARLSAGTQVLTGFATETSKALTAALTIGDTTGTGERAGRLLAGALATGIAAEAPRVREAIAAALTPAQLTSGIQEITAAVVAETATLAPELARQGAAAGEAYIGAIQGVVTQGASSLRQLTAGATVGVVVDTAPIRAATDAQQQLVAATTEATQGARQLDAAVQQIDASGIRETVVATESLANAQREWLREEQGISGSAQAAWARNREAANAAASEAKRNTAQAQRDAQQEAAARAQVRAEILGEIATLGRYGATVSGVNAEAVASWRAEAAAIKQQAIEVGASRDAMLRLEAVIQRTEAAFQRQQIAAERASAATASSAGGVGVGAGVGAIGADLAVLSRQAGGAKRAVDQVTIGGKSLQSSMNRLGPVVVGVGFGLEALARGGQSADAGLRTALRSIASFAAFFGGPGLIVAGVAAASAAILDLFASSREEIQKTQEQFRSSINQMIKDSDVKGLREQFKAIDEGLPDITKGGALTGGVVELSRELDVADRKVAALKRSFAAGFTDPTSAASAAINLTAAVLDARKLKDELIDAQTHSEQIAKLLHDRKGPLKKGFDKEDEDAAKKAAEEAAKALREQATQITVVQDALQRANGSATLHANIIAKALPLYDSLVKQANAHKNAVSETANELAKQLKALGDIDAVQIELTRRKLGGVVPDLGTIKVTGIIDKVVIPTPAAAQQLTIPVGLDEAEFQKSLKRIVDGVAGPNAKKIGADLFGTRQEVADATENLNIALSNSKRAFEAAILAELASADAGDVMLHRIKEIIAASEGLDISLLKSAGTASLLSDALQSIGDATTGIARAGDAMGIFSRQTLDAIAGVGELINASRELGRVNDDIAKRRKGGEEIGGLGALIQALPAISQLAGSFFSLGRAVLGPDQSAANQNIINEQIAAIQANTLELKHFGSTIGDQLGVKSALSDSGILSVVQAVTRKLPTASFSSPDQLDARLRAAGSSLAEVQKIAKQNGISLLDSKGRISAKALELLDASITETIKALTTFSNTLEDQSFIADARRQIFDNNDATSVATDWLDQLKKFAPDLFKQFFGGANAATKEGRAILEKGTRDLFEAAVAGKLNPELLKAFGGIKPFIEFLLKGDSALDSFTDAAKAAAGAMINVAEGFAVSNRVFKAMTQTANERDFFTPPPRPTPTPIPNSGGSTSGGQSLSLNVSVGGLTIGAPAQTKEQVYATIRRQALDKAAALGPTYRDAVEAAFPA